MTIEVTCPYCGKQAKWVSGRDVYPDRPELHRSLYYLRRDCDAYVGCHRDKVTPLGTLANRELRILRMRAHRAFDPLWKKGPLSRDQAYTLLADRMKLPAEKCHIAMFDDAQCQQVLRHMAEITFQPVEEKS